MSNEKKDDMMFTIVPKMPLEDDPNYDPMVHIVDFQNIQPVLDSRGRLLSCNTPPDTICPMADDWPRGWMQFVTMRKDGVRRDCLYCPPFEHTRIKLRSIYKIIEFALLVNLQSTRDVLKYHACWLSLYFPPNLNTTSIWDILLEQGDIVECACTKQLIKKAGIQEKLKIPYPTLKAANKKKKTTSLLGKDVVQE